MQCPKCSREMDEVRKLDVIIDSCTSCGGIWLDKGELDKIRQMEADNQRESEGHKGHESSQSHDDDYRDRDSGHGKKKKKRGGFMDLLEGFGGE